jgi:xylan 1,4-beta-xylosidase
MGAPQQPTTTQFAELEKAGQLALFSSPEWLRVTRGRVAVRFAIPRQGVSLLRLTW